MWELKETGIQHFGSGDLNIISNPKDQTIWENYTMNNQSIYVSKN